MGNYFKYLVQKDQSDLRHTVCLTSFDIAKANCDVIGI